MLQAYCKQSWSVACLSYSEIFSTCRSGISDTSEVPFSRDPKSGDFCSPDQRLFPQLTINYSSRCYPILFPLPKIQPPSTFAFWRIRNALRNGETNLKNRNCFNLEIQFESTQWSKVLKFKTKRLKVFSIGEVWWTLWEAGGIRFVSGRLPNNLGELASMDTSYKKFGLICSILNY